jgi:hypothetical protein
MKGRRDRLLRFSKVTASRFTTFPALFLFLDIGIFVRTVDLLPNAVVGL